MIIYKEHQYSACFAAPLSKEEFKQQLAIFVKKGVVTKKSLIQFYIINTSVQHHEMEGSYSPVMPMVKALELLIHRGRAVQLLGQKIYIQVYSMTC